MRQAAFQIPSVIQLPLSLSLMTLIAAGLTSCAATPDRPLQGPDVPTIDGSRADGAVRS